MSKLELIIKRCREVWEKNAIEPTLMDEMINSMATSSTIKSNIDVNNITDEQIMNATKLYMDMKQKLEKERKLWEKPAT